MTQYKPRFEHNYSVDVISVPQGWSVRLCRGNGKPDTLLKPGWAGIDDQNLPYKPYLFKTREEAWRFLTNVFWFTKRMDTPPKDPKVRDAQLQALIELNRANHTAHPPVEAKAVCVCEGCGNGYSQENGLIPSPYCNTCLHTNDTALEGFYHTLFHKTGSAADSLNRVAQQLKISQQQAAKRLHAIKANAVRQQGGNQPAATLRVPSEYSQRPQ